MPGGVSTESAEVAICVSNASRVPKALERFLLHGRGPSQAWHMVHACSFSSVHAGQAHCCTGCANAQSGTGGGGGLSVLKPFSLTGVSGSAFGTADFVPADD